uniref:Uncharacterized protein n=1 Tax=Macaca fascicularis TaxID=9541 RepID=A0A7N9DGJ9_MACFA
SGIHVQNVQVCYIVVLFFCCCSTTPLSSSIPIFMSFFSSI